MHWSRNLMENLFGETTDLEVLRRANRAAARRRERSVKNLKDRVEELEDWLGELALLNQTMLRMLLEKASFTKEELARVMREVDLLDGVADGKVTPRKPDAEAPEPKPRKKAARSRRRP